MNKVSEGSTVQIVYMGKLEDGTVIDKSEKDKPLEFVVGEHKVLPKIEEAVKGMKNGQSKELKLEPQDAFGERVEDLIKEVPRESLPKEPVPEKGMMLVLSTPDGKRIPTRIADVNEKFVKIDLNHPLAGNSVTFDIKVVGIK